ncbi:hypothetical protein, partial [Anaplasma marginale]|uniref:hypothetical protein n=1 Tax=Anaplasma marginale TaxID=770 RepID=UPI0005B35C77
KVLERKKPSLKTKQTPIQVSSPETEKTYVIDEDTIVLWMDVQNKERVEALENKFVELGTKIIIHKYERCLERLLNEWIPKLNERGIEELPPSIEKTCELIFSQPDYLTAKQKQKAQDENR